MKPVDTNWPGFQPLGCGSICTQGFALGWYRSAPLALEAHPPGVDFWGASQLRALSQTDPLPNSNESSSHLKPEPSQKATARTKATIFYDSSGTTYCGFCC